MVLIDWDQVAYANLDELAPTLDAVIQRAKNQAVTMTMCDGEVIYQGLQRGGLVDLGELARPVIWAPM